MLTGLDRTKQLLASQLCTAMEDHAACPPDYVNAHSKKQPTIEFKGLLPTTLSVHADSVSISVYDSTRPDRIIPKPVMIGINAAASVGKTDPYDPSETIAVDTVNKDFVRKNVSFTLDLLRELGTTAGLTYADPTQQGKDERDPDPGTFTLWNSRGQHVGHGKITNTEYLIVHEDDRDRVLEAARKLKDRYSDRDTAPRPPPGPRVK